MDRVVLLAFLLVAGSAFGQGEVRDQVDTTVNEITEFERFDLRLKDERIGVAEQLVEDFCSIEIEIVNPDAVVNVEKQGITCLDAKVLLTGLGA